MGKPCTSTNGALYSSSRQSPAKALSGELFAATGPLPADVTKQPATNCDYGNKRNPLAGGRIDPPLRSIARIAGFDLKSVSYMGLLPGVIDTRGQEHLKKLGKAQKKSRSADVVSLWNLEQLYLYLALIATLSKTQGPGSSGFGAQTGSSGCCTEMLQVPHALPATSAQPQTSTETRRDDSP